MRTKLTMSLSPMRLFGWTACLLLLASLTCSARAISAHVEDAAHFFSADAIKQADDQIRQIKDQYGKDLVIETYASPPAGKTVPTDTAGKQRFFQDWIDQRFHDTDTDGILVLICKNPSHLQVGSGRDTSRRLFTAQDSSQLTSSMGSYFRNKDFDGGLSHAVSSVRSTLSSRGANPSHAQQSSPPMTYSSPNNPTPYHPVNTSSHACLWAFIVIVGIFIVIRVLGHLAGSATGYSGGGGYGGQNYGGGQGGMPGAGMMGGGYGPGYGGGGGGGGFFRSMLGGVLGGAAGSWLYDRFNRPEDYGGNSGGNFGNNTGGGYNQGSNFDPSQQSDQGQSSGQSSGVDFGSSNDTGGSAGSDFGSAGSSFADSGGGGDFGGGGGGDSGGGGGGDSGGGGGDF